MKTTRRVYAFWQSRWKPLATAAYRLCASSMTHQWHPTGCILVTYCRIMFFGLGDRQLFSHEQSMHRCCVTAARYCSNECKYAVQSSSDVALLQHAAMSATTLYKVAVTAEKQAAYGALAPCNAFESVAVSIMTADRSMTHLMRWSPCWPRGVWAPLQGWTPCAPTQELVLLLLLQSWIAPSPHLHANRHSHTTLDIVVPCRLSTGFVHCLVYWPMDCKQPSPARKGNRDYNAAAYEQV